MAGANRLFDLPGRDRGRSAAASGTVIDLARSSGPSIPALADRDQPDRPAPPLYFINWWIDAALVGGLSLLAWLALSVFNNRFGANFIFALTFLFSLPHFSATVYRLYQSPQHTRQFPVTAWGVPWILLGAMLAAFWKPTLVAPYLFLLYFIWSPYHYSGQTIGLTMIYAKRSGFHIGRAERLALTTFILATFVCAITGIKSGAATKVFDISIPLPLFPAWAHAAAAAVMWTAAAVFIGCAIKWCLERKRLLPPIVLLPALTQFVWFVPGPTLLAFFAFVPMFHALQYLMVACVVQLKHRIDAPGVERSWRCVRSEALRWWFRNIAGGVLLFYGLPVIFSGAASLPFLTAVGVVAAAVNIHHFFVDGVIWKLRDGSNASALMTNVAEFSREPGAIRPPLAAARSA